MLDEIKQIFYNDFHKSFFVTISMLLFKILIEKGVRHIIEPQPSLGLSAILHPRKIVEIFSNQMIILPEFSIVNS